MINLVFEVHSQFPLFILMQGTAQVSNEFPFFADSFSEMLSYSNSLEFHFREKGSRIEWILDIRDPCGTF